MVEPPAQSQELQTVSYAPVQARRRVSFPIAFAVALLALQMALLPYSWSKHAERRLTLSAPLQPQNVLGVRKGRWIWIHVSHDLTSATSQTIRNAAGVQWVNYAGSLFSLGIDMAWTLSVNIAGIVWLAMRTKRVFT